jgi:hypothetical protein
MQFQFRNNIYRIDFQHDRSRNWVDHFGHPVELIRDTTPRTVAKSPKVHGPAMLVCLKCTAKYGKVFKLSHFNARERQMTTQCTITVWNGEAWYPLASGVAIVNQDAGDRMNRAQGRLRSFRRAVVKVLGEDLRSACWELCWQSRLLERPYRLKVEAAPAGGKA